MALMSIYSSTPTLFVLLLIGNIATWRRIDLARVNMACIPIFVALLILTLVITLRSTDGDWDRLEEWEAEYVDNKRLDLELETERKRLSAASLNLSSEIRRHVNRETVPALVEQYRSEGMQYRRTHNLFQSLIIIGSLATSTVAGIAETPAPYKWILVGTSFTVGLSAGFTGYFKFRERSFYLQQTADAIEEEYSSVTLKVGRYRDSTDDESALADFTQRIEVLKSDQRKRQQQLDQPTEARDGA
ncbi:SLATT domain-containing protein [Streptomyces sp. NPDC058855]|uniref:SLATT domain-containing protein n=1 Tax=Streptomyces sp. NPDC058855 TaxID=3346651 RepID=UPI0036B5961B